MKRVVSIIAALIAVAFVTVAAQAENKGEQIYKQKCAMCHIVSGQGGNIGAELTKIAAKMNEKDLKKQIESPKKKNPNSIMPSFKTLPKGDMEALLGYLNTLK